MAEPVNENRSLLSYRALVPVIVTEKSENVDGSITFWQFQIMSSWIHFEGQEGSTIHRHSKGVTLGYLFDTINIGLSSECFVFHDGREFCTSEEYSLKFYINGKKVDDIRGYVVSDGDRILVSYGPENQEEIVKQLEELNRQEIRS